MKKSKWNGAVHGGFFWVGDPAIEKCPSGWAAPLYRPHWWQVIAWYRVTRAWLGMAHDKP